MNFKDELLCNICKQVLNNPVSLPCHCVICGDHLYDGCARKDSITCETCSEDFHVPTEGFRENHMVQRILAKDGHLTDEEKTLKHALKEIGQHLDRLLIEIDSKKATLEIACYEHFAEIRRQIDFHREVMKAKIDDIMVELIDKAKKVEAAFMLKRDTILQDHAAKISRVDQEATETFLANEFRKQSILIEDVRRLRDEQDARLASLQTILDELGSLETEISSCEFKKKKVAFKENTFGTLRAATNSTRDVKLSIFDK